MDSVIGLLKDTPIPTILVVSGIVFLFLALVGSVAGKLEMPPARHKWSALASVVLLISGLLLYILPASPEGAAASPTSLPQIASQPSAPTAVQAGAQPGAQASESSSQPPVPVAAARSPVGGGVAGAKGCLAEFFTGIPANLITSLEAGAGKTLPFEPEQPGGMVLEEFGQPVAALSYVESTPCATATILARRAWARARSIESTTCLPLGAESLVFQGVPPAVFEELIFGNPPRQAHAQLLQHPAGGAVFGIAPRPDALHAQLLETKFEHRPRRFGGVALPPADRRDFIAQVGLRCLCRLQPQAAVADQRLDGGVVECILRGAGRRFGQAQGDYQLEFSPRPFLLLVDESLNESLDLLRLTVQPGVVVQEARVRLVSQDRRPIFENKLT